MNKKWLWIGIGVAGMIVIALIGILTIPNKPKQTAAPVQNTTQVSKGDITVSVSGSGSTVSTESESVRTKDEGKVSEVRVKAGDVVKKGQVLLTFEGNDNSDNLKAQQSSLESQRLDLVDLQDQFKRQVQEGADEQTLNATKKSITKQELNISNTETEMAKLQEESVPPDPLTSPIDGTVTAVNITAGEQAKSGSELFVINDYQKLSVKIQVDELDIPSVKEGMKANVQVDALPDQTFEGIVSDIADEGVASGGVSLFDVTVALNDSEGVRVGMSAEATIITEEKQDVLTLPIEAVQQRGGRYVVLLPGTGSGAEGAAGGAASRTGVGSPGADDATGAGDVTGTGNATGAGRAGQAGAGAASDGGPSSAAEGTPPQTGAAARNGSAAEAPATRQGRGTGTSGAAGGTGGTGGRMQVVEVGAHNETLIEIVSGLTEGQEVVIPTVISTSTGSAAQQQQMRMQGGFGGGSGFGGGGGAGFGGGAAPGGGGAAPTGGGGFSGGGGR
ncbi:efflux RND transporter periplasmic adaptor subunit [uncultured Paenibacillus sp.]|uniref:efflux RND transporter periplasmic adaptor subunit n=1 Tax=uncultured Paenibacillus sp. TaxID=227322 RepID=UPI0015AE4E7F|nr:efflux RND transporter periplasmic adaptor subunit [uncultured Paenibacillus sp.]